VIVVPRSQPRLMPDRRRSTIGRQSGGGPLQLPRSSGPGGHRQQRGWQDHLL